MDKLEQILASRPVEIIALVLLAAVFAASIIAAVWTTWQLLLSF